MGKTKDELLHFVLRVRATDDEINHWIKVAQHFCSANLNKKPICALSVSDPVPEHEKIFPVALLHDVVEDGYYTIVEISLKCGLTPEQIIALDAITRQKDEKYFDYIARVKNNKIATKVKLADLEENMKRCVADLPNRWGLIRRYAKAYGILTDQWEERSENK